MPYTMPVGAIATGPHFGANLSTTARALLDSGTVLAFRLTACVHRDGWSPYPNVSVALPDADTGVTWIAQSTDIIVRTAQIPTLMQACFEIAQNYTACFPLNFVLQTWTPDPTDRHYAELTILPSGTTLGQEDAGSAMDTDIQEAYEALEEGDYPEDFDTPRLLSVILPLPADVADSAHTHLQGLALGQKLVDEWLRVDPTWAHDPALPLVGPDLIAVASTVGHYCRAA